jgi:hypothetical protein
MEFLDFFQVEEMGQKNFYIISRFFIRTGCRGTAEIDTNPLFTSRD